MDFGTALALMAGLITFAAGIARVITRARKIARNEEAIGGPSLQA
jgi:hypothetical protein